jgi:uncharacterized protein (UPF0332 family)
MCKTGVPVAFCWKHYLDLANDLAKSTTDEAKLRASISRAYYAAFCNARNYMLKKDRNDFPPNIKSQHKYLVQYYKGDLTESKTDTCGTRLKLGKDLDSMRIDRSAVDYHDVLEKKDSLDKTTSDVLRRSKNVIAIVEQGGF